MAKTLTSFLLGIGLDFDTKGSKEAVSSLDQIKRSALQAGAAVGAVFGVKKITSGVAGQVREMSLLAEQIGTTTNNLFALDRAYQRAGGGAGQIFGQLERLKEMQAGLQVGDVGWMEAAAKAGINVNAIVGIKDPAKIYENLIGQLEAMSTNQRINAVSALGLDPSSINIASDGLAELRRQLNEANERRTFSENLQRDSDEFKRNWFDFLDNLGSVTDRAGGKIIPKVNEITASLNNFFSTNRSGINSGTDLVFGKIADNLELVAAATAAMGSAGTLAAFGKLVGMAPALGGVGAAIGAIASGMMGIATAATAIYAVLEYGGEDGFLSAKSLFGDNAITQFLDTPIGKHLEALDGLLSTDAQKAARSGMTVIEPSSTSQLSAPVQAAKTYQEVMSTQSTGYGYRPKAEKTMQPIVIQLDGRQMQQFVIETVEKADEQAVADLKSPIDR